MLAIGRWRRAWLALGLGLALAGAGLARADSPLAKPDAVKAAFLYRFTGYVEWPAPLGPDETFTVAVLGSEGVAEALVPMLALHRVQDRPARVQAISSIDDLGDARVLYVGPAFVGSLSAVMQKLRGLPVLVVSDRDGALEDGSMINFLLIEHRVRFEISLGAATAAGLKVGPGLLAVAVNVRGGPRSDLDCRDLAPSSAHQGQCPVQIARR
jgi:hypothetical protein